VRRKAPSCRVWQWGIEDHVARAGLACDGSLFFFVGETLLGEHYRRSGVTLTGSDAISPTDRLICSQEVLEPLLASSAARAGADVRFLTRLESLQQDIEGVAATSGTSGSPCGAPGRWPPPMGRAARCARRSGSGWRARARWGTRSASWSRLTCSSGWQGAARQHADSWDPVGMWSRVRRRLPADCAAPVSQW
jgi:FAD binding domain